MRILLIGDYPADARLGSTKVLFKLQEEFRKTGHTCDLLLGGELGSHPRNGYLRQAAGPVLALTAVRRMTRDHGPYDVIDVASAEGLWIGAFRAATGGRAAVVCRSNGLEHLNYQRMLDDHDAGLIEKPWTRRLFYPAVRLTQVAAAARKADRLLLLNPGDRDFALRRGWKQPSAIDIVPHGVSSRFFADAPAADAPRGRGILFCGTWTDAKGVSYLADGFSRLVARDARARLTVLGAGLPERIVRQAFPAEASGAVTVVDRAPEEQVMQAYRTHDLLALPSSYEGFGMVVVEAMSQRLPVVATPVGCAQTLIAHEQTGLLVPPRDAAALAAAMARMLGDAGLRARCAAAAFERVAGMTWASTAAQTLNVYARAINGGTHGS